MVLGEPTKQVAFVESHPFAKSAKGWGTRQSDSLTSTKEASQTRDYCVAKSATHRAARPDPSRRKQRLLGNDKRTLRRPLLGGWALPLLSRRLVKARPFFVGPAGNKELRESGGLRSR